MHNMSLNVILAAATIVLVLGSLRLLYILRQRPRPTPRAGNTQTHLLIVLGSGGHTAEMLAMLHDLPTERYTHRTYIINDEDTLSATKAQDFEETLSLRRPTRKGPLNDKDSNEWKIYTVPRARKIHQSLLTSPISCLQCLLSCLRILHTHPYGLPDLILTNGPATSLIFILASIIIRFFQFLPSLSTHTASDTFRRPHNGAMKTIYIESWARVKTPSLSLRLIAWGGLCSRVLVQHEALVLNGWGEFRGVFIT